MRYSNTNFVWGAIFIAIGALLLLDNLNYISLGDLLREYWPVLLILIGLALLLRGDRIAYYTRYSPKTGEFSSRSFVSGQKRVEQANTFGDLNITLESDNFEGGSLRTVFGEIKVDATKIHIPSGEKELFLNTVFGEIKLSVAKEFPIKVTATNVAGEIKIMDQKWEGLNHNVHYQSPSYESAPGKLHVIIQVTFGEIKIW